VTAYQKLKMAKCSLKRIGSERVKATVR